MSEALGAQSKAERIVGGFASLLSSALTVNNENSMEPLKESSLQLRRFVLPESKDAVCCVLPTLALQQKDDINNNSSNSNSNKVHHMRDGGNSNLQDAAAANLAKPMSLTRDVLAAAPMALLANVCESFSYLMDSRLRSSVSALLLRQNQHGRQQELWTKVLVAILSNKENHAMVPTTVVTSFRVVPVSDITPQGDLVMPLVMETVVDLQLNFSDDDKSREQDGNMVTVTLKAPGTIRATLTPHPHNHNEFRIQRAEIVLDTKSFLQSMMKQARHAVKKAVAVASNITTKILVVSLQQQQQQQQQQHHQHQQHQREDEETNSHGLHKQSSFIGIDKQSSNNGTSSLMPPPPSRPSKLSLTDLTSLSSLSSAKSLLFQQQQQPQQNAQWDVDAFSRRDLEDALRRGAGLASSGSLASLLFGHQHQQPQHHHHHQLSPSSSSSAGQSAASRAGLSLLTAAAGIQDKKRGLGGKDYQEPPKTSKRVKLEHTNDVDTTQQQHVRSSTAMETPV